MSTFIDKLVFPAPAPTYNKETFKKHLCWIPWNEAVSPDRLHDERCAVGIPCLWLPAPKAAGVILFCHGNAEDLGMCFPFLKHMRDQFKMNVLAVEYPGYGLLSGVSTSEATLKEVALTAFRFILDELKVAYEQVILFGRSVGSGPSVYLASRFPVGGLILVAAFASIREAAKSLVGNLIAQVLDERFPNISLIGNVSCPTLFIHGEKDSLVPPSHSVALFKQCRTRKLLITPPGMEHNTNLFTDAQFLAVPAINFFGLPGYQQESPPEMPQRFFEDGREQFLQRMRRKRSNAQKKELAAEGRKDEDTSVSSNNPWFFLCGGCSGAAAACARYQDGVTSMEQQPLRENQHLEMDAELAEWDPTAMGEAQVLPGESTTGPRDPVASAGRETAASAIAAAKMGVEEASSLKKAGSTGRLPVVCKKDNLDDEPGWKCAVADSLQDGLQGDSWQTAEV